MGAGVKSLGSSPVEALGTAKGEFKGGMELGGQQAQALSKEKRAAKADQDDSQGETGAENATGKAATAAKGATGLGV